MAKAALTAQYDAFLERAKTTDFRQWKEIVESSVTEQPPVSCRSDTLSSLQAVRARMPININNNFFILPSSYVLCVMSVGSRYL